MIQLNRILIPTDFSPHAERAAAYGFALAEKFTAKVHMLHVLETVPAPMPDFVMGLAIPARIEESEENALKGISRFLEKAGWNTSDVVCAACNGTPFVEIIRYAKQHEIDLIVLGTH